ncbi:unnamed protein product [Acanthoscelides obtectus]|uniref:C2H2-type domain-containing protein n=1 Tax=Acanthoscelides obtectus TaxID=200917 RepID=A0A9P0KNX0_ACAOB|nr:unnamed protein product [Acanthoscelides obtectus]CAK1675601.1 PR domain zinc finger protein 5 [Acanthoscelides obtectus]
MMQALLADRPYRKIPLEGSTCRSYRKVELPKYCIVQRFPLSKSKNLTRQKKVCNIQNDTSQKNSLPKSTLHNPHVIVNRREPLTISSPAPDTVVLKKGTPLGTVRQNSLESPSRPHAIVIEKDPLDTSSSAPGSVVLQKGTALGTGTIDCSSTKRRTMVIRKDPRASSSSAPCTVLHTAGTGKPKALLSSTLPSRNLASHPGSLPDASPSTSNSAPVTYQEKTSARRIGVEPSKVDREISMPYHIVPTTSLEKYDALLRKIGVDPATVDPSTVRLPRVSSEGGNKEIPILYDQKMFIKAKKMKDRHEDVECRYRDPFDYGVLRKVPSPPAKSTEKREDRRWQCLMCHLIMKNKAELMLHYAGHKKIRDGIPSNDAVIKEDEKEKKYKCPSCHEIYKNDTEYNRHVKLKHLNMNRPFCQKCERYCDTYLDLSLHIETYHEKKKGDFKCCVCKSFLWSRQQLENHVTTLHEHTVYDCGICNMKFTTKEWFDAHSVLHSVQTEIYVCRLCGKQFETQECLEVHKQKRHHIVPVEYRRKIECKECHITFPTEYNKERHDANIHKEKAVDLCTICGKAFTRHAMISHRRIHKEKVPCEVCGKLVALYCMGIHMRTHTGEKPYKCSQCDKCFTQRPPLKMHLRSHTGERPYECIRCKKGFISKAGRDGHTTKCRE